MALIVPTNCSVTIYQGSNASAPYTLGAVRSSTSGYLEPAVQNGRFGSASWLKWTHILLIPPEVEIHDAYNSQLDPARNNALGDTVILLDSGGVNRTAFYVVFIEVIGRGTSAAHQRVYLDRFAPSAWPDDAL
jgi:hypothetical protein